MRSIDRRNFIRGIGAAAVSVPLLRSLRVFAQEATFPTRIVFFFTPNGTSIDQWRPTGGGESTFRLGPILEPLEPFREKILLLDGVDLVSARTDTSLDVHRGVRAVLTGARDQYGAGTYTAGGMSVDQHIADAVGRETRFKSLELGVQTSTTAAYTSYWSRICFRGPNEPVPPEDDPWAVYDRVFRGIDRDAPEYDRLEALRADRRSVLDVVAQDVVALQSRLPAEDRPLLESHPESIRELERRFQDPANALGKYCEAPALGSRIDDVQAQEGFPDVGRLQMDQIAMALACDVTRVATLQWSRAVAPTVYSWVEDVGYYDGHTLSHMPDSDASTWGEDGKMTRISRWYAEQYAYLLGRLDAIPEGDGTLLDHTVVVWCNELGRGNIHDFDVKWVLAGSANGAFRTGRYLEYDRESHCNLLVSLCNAMGLSTRVFGETELCDGPLRDLA